uniref:Uncharacterized protein n=1 Tax=Arundo donax TaxID=35708 RepID=A0A0A9HRX2_ARUDO
MATIIQYWHQKRSMCASLGRVSTVLKHSNAGIAYPNSRSRILERSSPSISPDRKCGRRRRSVPPQASSRSWLALLLLGTRVERWWEWNGRGGEREKWGRRRRRKRLLWLW